MKKRTKKTKRAYRTKPERLEIARKGNAMISWGDTPSQAARKLKVSESSLYRHRLEARKQRAGARRRFARARAKTSRLRRAG